MHLYLFLILFRLPQAVAFYSLVKPNISDDPILFLYMVKFWTFKGWDIELSYIYCVHPVHQEHHPDAIRPEWSSNHSVSLETPAFRDKRSLEALVLIWFYVTKKNKNKRLDLQHKGGVSAIVQTKWRQEVFSCSDHLLIVHQHNEKNRSPSNGEGKDGKRLKRSEIK